MESNTVTTSILNGHVTETTTVTTGADGSKTESQSSVTVVDTSQRVTITESSQTVNPDGSVSTFESVTDSQSTYQGVNISVKSSAVNPDGSKVEVDSKGIVSPTGEITNDSVVTETSKSYSKVTNIHTSVSTDKDGNITTLEDVSYEASDGSYGSKSSTITVSEESSSAVIESTDISADGTRTERTENREITPDTIRTEAIIETAYPDGLTSTILEGSVRTSDKETVSRDQVDKAADGSSTRTQSEVTTIRGLDGSLSVSTKDIFTDAKDIHTTTETETLTSRDAQGNIITAGEVKVTSEDGSSLASKSRSTVSPEGTTISLNVETERKDADGKVSKFSVDGNADQISVSTNGSSDEDIRMIMSSLEGMESKSYAIDIASSTGEVPLSAESLDSLAERGFSLTVEAGNNTVTLDPQTLKGFADLEGDVLLTVVVATADNTPEIQMEVVGDLYAVHVTARLNGTQVHELLGKVEITIDPGYDATYVYHVTEEGEAEPIVSEYDPVTGKVAFDVDHLSLFMVSATEYVKPNDWTGYASIMIAVLVMLMLLVVMFILVRKKTKEDE